MGKLFCLHDSKKYCRCVFFNNGLKGKPFVLHDSWSFTSNLSKEDKEKISVALINVINSWESLNHADYMGIVLYAPSFQVY